ncbi:MAG TPA: hypothetical protein VIU93_02575 [Gallionellaceae bacterium]
MTEIERRAMDFFAWFNRTYPEPSLHTDHPYNRLGIALTAKLNEPGELEALEEERKVCTMNCGPSLGDTRTEEERREECDECLTVKNKRPFKLDRGTE